MWKVSWTFHLGIFCSTCNMNFIISYLSKTRSGSHALNFTLDIKRWHFNDAQASNSWTWWIFQKNILFDPLPSLGTSCFYALIDIRIGEVFSTFGKTMAKGSFRCKLVNVAWENSSIQWVRSSVPRLVSRDGWPQNHTFCRNRLDSMCGGSISVLRARLLWIKQFTFLDGYGSFCCWIRWHNCFWNRNDVMLSIRLRRQNWKWQGFPKVRDWNSQRGWLWPTFSANRDGCVIKRFTRCFLLKFYLR